MNCHLAENLGPNMDTNLEPAAFGGHCLYVRRCLPGEAASEDDINLRSQDGVIIPPAMGNFTPWGQVVAVGRKFGKKCSRVHARKWRKNEISKYKQGRTQEQAEKLACLHYGVKPEDVIGARVFIGKEQDERDERIERSPFADYEYFIEESLPDAYEVGEKVA